MDTWKAFKLARKISNKTGHSTCIDQKVWHHEHDPSKLYSGYTLSWFVTSEECKLDSFPSFKELELFAKEKWNV
jgi:hypothetical protein